MPYISVYKWKKLIIFMFLLVMFFFILGQILQDHDKKKRLRKWQKSNSIPVIIWWTPILTGYSETRLCDKYFCQFTTSRKEVENAKAFLFYGSDVKIDDFPLPRQPHHVWGLMHEESPRNVAFMPYKEWLQNFNFTSTFSRHSDLPMTTFYLPHSDNLTTPAYTIPIGQKTILNKDQALVFFMQSDCDTMSGRDDYVKELMNYISVDSFGACLKNKELPESLQNIQSDYLNNLYAPELLKFMARYKFIISYENGVCEDYITEKFWRPLIAGSIPIYFGSPSIKDWAPNEKSVIDVSNFSSPEALASFLKELNTNDRAYNSYLNHKYNMITPITNTRLLNELGRRKAAMYGDNQFQSFECAICSFIHKHSDITQKHIANELHYQCPHQPVYPPMKNKVSNHDDWRSVMSIGKCKAILLDRLLRRNKNYTEAEFMDLLTKEVSLDFTMDASTIFYKIDAKSLQRKSDLKGVCFTKPRLVACYNKNNDSIEATKKIFYFKMPKTENYPIDLNEGYNPNKQRNKPSNLTDLQYSLKYAMSPEARINLGNIDQIKVFTRMPTLIHLMGSYYSNKNKKYLMRVSRYNGDLYMIHVYDDNDNWNHSNLYKPVHNHHRQFLNNVFTEYLKDEPTTKQRFADNEELMGVYQSSFGKFEMIYCGGVQGIIAEEEVKNLEEDVIGKLNGCHFVMAQQLWWNLRKDETRHLGYWLKAYLCNISDMYLGYKNSFGIIHKPIVHISTSDLPLNFNWKPKICLEFLYEFLERVNDLLTYDNINSLTTIYEFCFDTNDGTFTYTILKETADAVFITKEYMDYCEQL